MHGKRRPGRTITPMTIRRMEHIGIVVDDLDAAIAFFRELGLVLEGEGQVDGDWVERIVGLEEVRVEVAMLRTPNGEGRLELARFVSPARREARWRTRPLGDGHGPRRSR